MAQVYFTLIRHGESTDNLKAIWAGTRDAPLTNHGMNQARALGVSLAQTRFSAILSSPLKRALTTAEELQAAQSVDPKPQTVTSPLLQERNFGEGEGKPYKGKQTPGKTMEWHYEQGIYPSPRSRADKFPGGESAHDLEQRAETVINQILLPYAFEAARSGQGGRIDVAVTSHGMFLNELTAALLKRSATNTFIPGLRNTAWHRIRVAVQGAVQGEPMEFSEDELPDISVSAVGLAKDDHLDSLVRQKGGIGSLAHDRKQKDIRGFFGGKSRTGLSKGS